MLELLAIIVRLVPGIVALAVMTAWFLLITPIAFAGWLVSAPLWAVFALPLKFIGAALMNELQSFREEVAAAVDHWLAAPFRFLGEVGNGYGGVLALAARTLVVCSRTDECSTRLAVE